MDFAGTGSWTEVVISLIGKIRTVSGTTSGSEEIRVLRLGIRDNVERVEEC